jgi:hypothetical protein
MTQAVTISVGDKMWCTHRRLPSPLLGTIIVLTDEPGKMIGLEFEEEVNGHTCDGRGQDKKCLWVLPIHIMTEVEYADMIAAEQSAIVAKPNEFQSITLN